jgi:hypothetical protein
MKKTTLGAFALGAILGVPLLAHSGPDPCNTSSSSTYDEATLVVTSMTIDGVDQPFGDSTGILFSRWMWTGDHLGATLPDPRGPVDAQHARTVYLERGQ